MPIEAAVTAHVSGTTWTSVSRAVPMNIHAADFGASFIITLSTAIGSARNYDVEHTLDNVMQAGVSGRYMDHSTVSAETVAQDGSYTEPVAAIRLKVNNAKASVAAVSGLTVTMRVIQAGD